MTVGGVTVEQGRRARRFSPALAYAFVVVSLLLVGCSSPPAGRLAPPAQGPTSSMPASVPAPKEAKRAAGASETDGAGAASAVPAKSAVAVALAVPNRQPISDADRRYARRLLGEQYASRVNIAKLAAGLVSEVVIDSWSVSGSTWKGNVTVRFADNSAAPGTLVLSRFGGVWYFSSITGGRTGTTGGDADSISRGAPPADAGPNDPSLVAIFIQQTRANQEWARNLVAGKYKRIKVDSVERGLSTATLRCTLFKTAGGTQPARVGILRKTKVWYIVRATL